MDRCKRSKGVRGGAFEIIARPHSLAEARHGRGREGLAKEKGASRLGLPALAERVWRARRYADRARDLAAGRRHLWEADAAVSDRRGHVRADGDGLWQRGTQTALPAETGFRRTDLVPAVFRARRRIRCRGPANARREKRRQ